MGISKPLYKDGQYDKPDVTYNGKTMSYYAATQEQRKIERSIRHWKRQEAGLKSCGQDHTAETAKVRKYQDKMKDFLEQTGLDRQREREVVYNLPLKSKGFSDNIKDNNSNDEHISITQETIDRVPRVESSLLSKSQNTILQQRHKGLLEYMKDDPPKTEGAAYYTMNLQELDKYKGVPGTGFIKSKNFDRPYIAIHNHPSGKTFGHDDIDRFADSGNMKILSAIGNNGRVFLIEKTQMYNSTAFKLEWMQVRNKLLEAYNNDEKDKYINLISSFLKGIEKYGARFNG